MMTNASVGDRRKIIPKHQFLAPIGEATRRLEPELTHGLLAHAVLHVLTGDRHRELCLEQYILGHLCRSHRAQCQCEVSARSVERLPPVRNLVVRNLTLAEGAYLVGCHR